jgi:hypothetical protein
MLTFGIVEDGIFGEDFFDRSASTHGIVVIKHIMEIAKAATEPAQPVSPENVRCR